MPVRRGKEGQRYYFQYGKTGKKYYFTTERGMKTALGKAKKQGRAIETRKSFQR